MLPNVVDRPRTRPRTAVTNSRRCDAQRPIVSTRTTTECTDIPFGSLIGRLIGSYRFVRLSARQTVYPVNTRELLLGELVAHPTVKIVPIIRDACRGQFHRDANHVTHDAGLATGVVGNIKFREPPDQG